jgi:hypothetical protein
MKNNRIISAVISIIIGVCIGLAVGNIPTAEATATEKPFSWLESYEETADHLELFKVYNSADLTEERLLNRKGDLIIEKVYGVVINAEGEGKVLETQEDFKKAHNRDYDTMAEHNYYIDYKDTAEAKEGDIILSFIIYNPDTFYKDDIVARFDYIMDSVED